MPMFTSMSVNDKLCLMMPTEGWKKQNKTCARIKYSMLIFTRISVKKNNSLYNLDGQKI